MDRIRSFTRSIGTVIGLFPQWKGFSYEESMYRADGAHKDENPRKGDFVKDECGSSRTGGMDFVSSLIHATAPQARSMSCIL